jgi:hypothetical protein
VALTHSARSPPLRRQVFTSKETSGAQISNGEKMSQAKDLLKVRRVRSRLH